MGIRRQIAEESLANVEYVARDSAKLRAPLAPLPEEHGRDENEGFDGAAGLGSADAPQRRAGAEPRRTKPGAAPHEVCGGEGAVPNDGRYKEPTLRNRVRKTLSCPRPCTAQEVAVLGLLRRTLRTSRLLNPKPFSWAGRLRQRLWHGARMAPLLGSSSSAVALDQPRAEWQT
jgi:hypothetical protein